jgi:serine/threonine protein kinase
VHKETGETVAIKILDKKKIKLDSCEMVRNEIESLKLCQHSNIVRLYDVMENANHIFLIMELLPGGTLRDYVKRSKAGVPEEAAKRIVASIASAIEYMGKYGIVHRDLKLINVLLTSDGPDFVVKLADFGLAKILAPAQKCKGFAGTLHFCAPEVILSIPYTQSVDIWSLGIITHYLLYSTLPFDCSNDSELKRYPLPSPILDSSSKKSPSSAPLVPSPPKPPTSSKVLTLSLMC